MRTSLILLASAVLLVACSNDAETTAPQSTVPSTLNGSQGTKLDLPPGPGVLARGQRSDSVMIVFSPLAQYDGVIQAGASAFATCPSGSVRVGGGFRIQGGWIDIRITQSEPSGANGWYVAGMGTNGTPASFYAIATCVLQ